MSHRSQICLQAWYFSTSNTLIQHTQSAQHIQEAQQTTHSTSFTYKLNTLLAYTLNAINTLSAAISTLSINTPSLAYTWHVSTAFVKGLQQSLCMCIHASNAIKCHRGERFVPSYVTPTSLTPTQSRKPPTPLPSEHDHQNRLTPYPKLTGTAFPLCLELLQQLFWPLLFGTIGTAHTIWVLM